MEFFAFVITSMRGWWPWKSESAKECVTTYNKNCLQLDIQDVLNFYLGVYTKHSSPNRPSRDPHYL